MKPTLDGTELLDLLDDLDAGVRDTGFSTCFSNLIAVPGPEPGVPQAHLAYNRRCRVLDNFLVLPGAIRRRRDGPLLLEQDCDWGRFVFAFADTDAWFARCDGLAELDLGLQVAGLRALAVAQIDERTVCWTAELPNTDARDPDPFVPVVLAWRVRRGVVELTAEHLRVRADPEGCIELAGALRLLDGEVAAAIAALAAVPADEAQVLAAARRWWCAAVGPLRLTPADTAEARFLARAVHVLLANAVRAPGLLAGRVANYPNRGRYPAHYLWDSCFHCLGLAELTPGLARDSLRLLADTRSEAGKVGHFLCSTWIRPDESQPPLLGWAARRLLDRRWNADDASALLAALEANGDWWRSARSTSCGLIGSDHPMETGWDDTARYDQGPVVPVDLNAYLVEQDRAAVTIAEGLGQGERAARNAARADAHAALLLKYCYDTEQAIFRDLRRDDLSPLAIATPAGLLPIWAGVLPDADEARAALRRWLLPPGPFAGPVPYPSVDPRHPSYVPRNPGIDDPHACGACWRGPAWPPLTWLMFESLERAGFVAEAEAVAARLYALLRRDGHLCEFLDAETGTGLGAPAQGWTAAIALALHRRLVPGDA